MKLKSLITFIFLHIVCLSVFGQADNIQKKDRDSYITFIVREPERKVDVFVDGKPFTTYCWPGNVYKPILYPVFTSSGTEITRGFPLKPREGERNDHIHQAGIWLNYGNVNGIDFWGNGHRGIKEPEGGEIKHLSFEKISGGKREGLLIAIASWLSPSGEEMLAERTEYHFIAEGTLRIIDRITLLTAGKNSVSMKDTKEGMFAIRVARQLELPSNEPLILLDANGDPKKEKVVTIRGITGNYRSSEGISGEDVWSTRARWMLLTGVIGEEKISLVICDHPGNQSYPTYWHARGYGLFAANPLGWSDFTKGKEALNYTIQAGKSAIFRYRVIINSGSHLSDDRINELAREFASRY